MDYKSKYSNKYISKIKDTDCERKSRRDTLSQSQIIIPSNNSSILNIDTKRFNRNKDLLSHYESNDNNSKKQSINESHKRSKSNQPVSLRNIGASCYLNSAMQGISSCYNFVDGIIQLQKENNTLSKLSTFSSLLERLSYEGGPSLDVSNNVIFREWNKYGQQDSYELLCYVINQVYNELRKDKVEQRIIEKGNLTEWLHIELPLRILLQYEIKCDCGKESLSPLQSDLSFHLSMKRGNIQDLMDYFFEEEPIQDYECDDKKCKNKGAKRTVKLYRYLSATICIHLQRTYWDGRRMVKIDDKVNFTESLTMKKEYFKNQKGISNLDINRKGFIYSLKAVIVHSGSVSSGHYICYKLIGNDWFYTSDSYSYKVTWRDVSSCQAYILFYDTDTMVSTV